YEKARADLAKASEFRPEDAVLFEFLSCACDELGDEVGRDAAIERLRALGKVPAYLLQLRGEKRLKAGNRDGAEADLRAAAALDDPFAAYLLQANGMSLETGEELAAFGLDREKRNLNPQAVELYREAIAKGFATPERDVAVRARLAYNIGARGNDWAQAALVTTALVEAHPERADAWMHHATVDPQTASYHRAYELDPPTSAAKYARHLAVAGRTEEALAICARHLTERPYDGALRAAQGIALHALGRLDEAKAAWRDAARLGDRSATKLRVDAFGSETGHDSFDLASECMNRRDLSGASRFYAGGRALAQGDCRGRRRGVSVPREEPLQPRIRQ
ncbi:MAG: hypothetical protein H5U40_15320, partial [Polyangiaceae bacterium]|nr:hypothetical protein [Polyangiaceae bacterium]